MSILDRFKKAAKSGPQRKRGPRRTAAEMREVQVNKALRALEREDPLAWREIMLDGLTGRRREKASNPIDDMVSTVAKLRDAGFIDDPKTAVAEKDDWFKDALKELAPAVGMILMQMQQSNMAAQHQQTRVNVVQQPTAPVMQAPMLEANEEPEPPHTEQPEDVPMTIIAQIIISQLEDKEPDDAAKWLSEQSQAKGFVQLIMNSTDDDIPATLVQLAQQGPDYAAIVNWLRTRPEWFLQTVRAVRALQHSPASKRRMGF